MGPDVHWREASEIRTRFRRSNRARETRSIYTSGYVATVLAALPLGLVFGLLQAAISAMQGYSTRASSIGIGIVGGMLGAAYITNVVAAVVFPLFGFIQWMGRLSAFRTIIVGCAGGWCGFIVPVLASLISDELPGFAFAFPAMLGGQAAAGWAARREAARLRRFKNAAIWMDPADKVSLRQIFGIMTAIAVTAAALSLVPIPENVLLACLAAALLQGAIVALYLVIRRKIRVGEPTLEIVEFEDD